MEMNFVGAFELEKYYGWMVDFSRIGLIEVTAGCLLFFLCVAILIYYSMDNH